MHCLNQRLGSSEEQDTALGWGQSNREAWQLCVRLSPHKSAVLRTLRQWPCSLTKGKIPQSQTPIPRSLPPPPAPCPALANPLPGKCRWGHMRCSITVTPCLQAQVAFYRSRDIMQTFLVPSDVTVPGNQKSVCILWAQESHWSFSTVERPDLCSSGERWIGKGRVLRYIQKRDQDGEVSGSNEKWRTAESPGEQEDWGDTK